MGEVCSMKDLLLHLHKYDKKGDGAVPKNDLGVFIRSFGYNMKDSEVESEITNKVGVNADGTVDIKKIQDFIGQNTSDLEKFDGDTENREMFHNFDKDGDGFIDFGELKEMLRAMGDEMEDEDIQDML